MNSIALLIPLTFGFIFGSVYFTHRKGEQHWAIKFFGCLFMAIMFTLGLMAVVWLPIYIVMSVISIVS